MSPSYILLQMLPILIYIIVDSIWSNPIYSITAAIVCAAVQLWITWSATHTIDYFILIDVGLIVIMGLISLILKDEKFFKLKPAIINVIFIVFVGIMVVGSEEFITGYIGRMLPQGKSLNPQALSMMKQMLIAVLFVLIAHTASVIYTALYCSKKMWAFVAGPGMFLLFIPVMIFLLYKRVRAKA